LVLAGVGVHPGKFSGKSVGSFALTATGGGFRKIFFARHMNLPGKQFSPDLPLREDLRIREKAKEKGK
jgi:hypothetical protein